MNLTKIIMLLQVAVDDSNWIAVEEAIQLLMDYTEFELEDDMFDD